MTTSRKIAEVFGKRHDNVVRDIELIISSLKNEERNFFILSTYKNRGKDYKQYLLTRDGATLHY